MSKKRSKLVEPLAPEDIERGSYVAVLHIIDQYLPFCDLLDAGQQRPKPVSVKWLPEDEPQPLEVIDVCLPFVSVRKADGSVKTLDVRRHQLGRLSTGYARRVMAGLRRASKKKPDEEK